MVQVKVNFIQYITLTFKGIYFWKGVILCGKKKMARTKKRTTKKIIINMTATRITTKMRIVNMTVIRIMTKQMIAAKTTTRKTTAKKMAVKNTVRVKVKALVRSPEKENANNFFISKSTCTKKGQSRKSRQPLTFIYPPKMELDRIISETRKWICYSSGGLMDCIRITISLSFTGLLI
jgi:hypothetical protein